MSVWHNIQINKAKLDPCDTGGLIDAGKGVVHSERGGYEPRFVCVIPTCIVIKAGGRQVDHDPVLVALFLDDDGGMIGSLVVLDVADRAAAEAWAAGDPYARAGLFARVEIRRWNKVIGA